MTDVPEENRIYAGQLRAIGIALPDELPDCAWVERDAMHIQLGEAKAEDDGSLTIESIVTFDKPFNFITATFIVERPAP